MMTPRQRVEAVLRHERPDQTPFTIYESKLPQCSVERRLPNDGLCIVERRVPVVRTSTPHVASEARHYQDGGVDYVRRVFRTPVGDLSTLDRPAGFTTWHVERLFRRPEDYQPLLFLIRDTRAAL